ncbi:MAG: helix-turn-helix transcriptional regulator [Myxococcota bacterium]
MSTQEVIAANLRILRDLRGMSQLDLAERVGVSRRTVARLEAGDIADPGVQQIQNLAEALGVTVALLIEQKLSTVRVPIPEALVDRIDAARLEGMIRSLKG